MGSFPLTLRSAGGNRVVEVFLARLLNSRMVVPCEEEVVMRYPVQRQQSSFDATLFEPHQARRGNCGLKLYVKVFLRKVDPAGGAAQGTADDWDTRNGSPAGPARRIVRWSAGEFERWSQRYQRECQSFWDGKFWLSPPNTYTGLDVAQRSGRLRPNVRCDFVLSLVSTPSLAHHTIDVVRLADNEPFFRSDAAHYDHRDLDADTTSPGVTQRAHVHEVGHLLGLGHATSGAAGCSNHNAVCYASNNVMGRGEQLAAWNAKPWKQTVSQMTGTGESGWTVSMREVTPRALR
jgi:hypothetical protein